VNFIMVEIPTPKPYIFMIRVNRQIKCPKSWGPGSSPSPTGSFFENYTYLWNHFVNFNHRGSVRPEKKTKKNYIILQGGELFPEFKLVFPIKVCTCMHVNPRGELKMVHCSQFWSICLSIT
jgi:hypothetical protein